MTSCVLPFLPTRCVTNALALLRPLAMCGYGKDVEILALPASHGVAVASWHRKET